MRFTARFLQASRFHRPPHGTSLLVSPESHAYSRPALQQHEQIAESLDFKGTLEALAAGYVRVGYQPGNLDLSLCNLPKAGKQAIRLVEKYWKPGMRLYLEIVKPAAGLQTNEDYLTAGECLDDKDAIDKIRRFCGK